MAKREPGFTKFDNYFLDHVLPRVSGVEWKIISVIIRGTVGWQQQGGKHRQEVELTNERLQKLTGVGSQALCAGIKKAMDRGVVKRRPRQQGRQRTFCFSAVPRANLKSLDHGDSSTQEHLPFISDRENHNPNSDDQIVVSTIPTTVLDHENHNPNSALLISVKKDIDPKTHTHRERVCASRFSKQQIRAYAWASYHCDEVLRNRGRKVEGIRNPDGWAVAAHRSGEFDDLIQEWIDNPEIFKLASGY